MRQPETFALQGFFQTVKVLAALFLILESFTIQNAFGAAEDMVLIPSGEFLMGSSPEKLEEVKRVFGKRELYRSYPFDAEKPLRSVFVKSFKIDRYEVSNRQYMEFVKATGHKAPINWVDGKYEAGLDDYPVLYVSCTDAEAYAKWAGKRLPTKEEWEKSARGVDGRIYPWGDTFDPYKAVTADSDLRDILGALCRDGAANKVGLAPGDVTPYGVHDMAGNVREWTLSTNPNNSSMAVVKGASWVDLHINARSAHEEYVPKNAASRIIGFRCAKDIEQ